MEIIGRSTSHFTRVVRIVAHELTLQYQLAPIHDLKDVTAYAGNPALKMPSLRVDGELLFGTENICRKLVGMKPGFRMIWPEALTSTVARNAQEMIWHAMSAHVQLILGVLLGKLPADDPYFAKIRLGLIGAMDWLEAHAEDVIRQLPARDLSLLEVTLFCLVEHIEFRATFDFQGYPRLKGFARTFAGKRSAQETIYQIDKKPIV